MCWGEKAGLNCSAFSPKQTDRTLIERPSGGLWVWRSRM